MPTSISAAKRVRQNEKRNLANRQRRSAVTSAIRALRKAVESGDAAAVSTAVRLAYQRIDKAARGRAIHPNTAARRKSLVARTARRKA